jgi:hypothetical protein
MHKNENHKKEIRGGYQNLKLPSFPPDTMSSLTCPDKR